MASRTLRAKTKAQSAHGGNVNRIVKCAAASMDAKAASSRTWPNLESPKPRQ